MRVLQNDNGNRGQPKDNEALRRVLLAKIHIARKDLGWTEERYRRTLEVSFGVPTAAALTIDQLKSLVKGFFVWGWRPKPSRRQIKEGTQAKALHHRIRDLAAQIKGTEKRMYGLCRKLCGTDMPEWCTDLAKLRRLLAVLGNIKRKEAEMNSRNG